LDGLNCKPLVWKFNEIPVRTILPWGVLATIAELQVIDVDTLWKLTCIPAPSETKGFFVYSEVKFDKISFNFLSPCHKYDFELHNAQNILILWQK